MKTLGNLTALVFFIVITYLSYGLIRDSLIDQQDKFEVSEINHIMYGVFNVNAWKKQLSTIIFVEINKLDLKTTSMELKGTIENQLTALIDKLNEKIRETNSGSFSGKIKQMLIDLVVDIEQVKKGVPAYADAVIEEMTKPESEKAVKELAAKQLKNYLKKTFVKHKTGRIDSVLQRTGTTSVKDATEKLNSEISLRKFGLTTRGYVLIGLTIFIFLYMAIPSYRSRFGVTMLSAMLVVLLVVGISIPMIDLEAKIAEFSFSLLGHRIKFENQILYFQSKSIIDVFWLMITHKDAKMKFVGVLLVLFSVVLPLFKLIASMIYCYFEKSRNNRFVEFFAFKTGKWSMADVMVVAIVMAYIGFNGIVQTQFGKMAAVAPKGVTFFATNGTSLQLGFYVFLTYAILAMVLASYMKRLR